MQILICVGFMQLCMVLCHTGPQFEKSRDAEIDEKIHYLYARDCDSKIETIDDFTKRMLAHIHELDIQDADNIQSIDDRIQALEKMIRMQHDLQSAFRYLKQKLGIPAEVQLMYDMAPCVKRDMMMYQPLNRRVTISQDHFQSGCPSNCLFTMIHELTHAQQHMRKGMLNFLLDRNDKALLAQLESEADTNAAQVIKCLGCMKAVVAWKLISEHGVSPEDLADEKAQGYLLSDDLQKHLKQKSLDDVCTAHKGDTKFDIWSGLDTLEGQREIVRNDRLKWCLDDRLSSI